MDRVCILFLLLLTGCASNRDASLESMLMGSAPRRELPPRQMAEVEKHPLGSAENPVRAHGPAGQRAYLSRLLCPEGKPPVFERSGSAGISPYGSIMDIYEVACDAPPRRYIYIDMYHPGHVETRAVDGFTMEPPANSP